jgi:hypothetical protein
MLTRNQGLSERCTLAIMSALDETQLAQVGFAYRHARRWRVNTLGYGQALAVQRFALPPGSSPCAGRPITSAAASDRLARAPGRHPPRSIRFSQHSIRPTTSHGPRISPA